MAELDHNGLLVNLKSYCAT